MVLKKAIFDSCVSVLDSKIEELQKSIASIEDAVNNETKSTAGDKHETLRAMMQLEREKLGTQLKELTDQKGELQKINIHLNSETIIKGSYVKTDKGDFFIGVALGKLKAGEGSIYAISAQSPLGSKLMGLQKNNTAVIHNVTYTVLEIS